LPASIAIMGSGAVGVEFASIFRRFGSEVTIVELLPRLVPLEDEAVSAELEKSFRKQGIAIHTGTKVTSAKVNGSGVDIEAQLAHVSSAEGIIAAERIAGQDVRPLNYDHVPGCTYCDPEIGSVGLSEQKARERGFDVRVGVFPFGVLGRAKMSGETEGFVKIV